MAVSPPISGKVDNADFKGCAGASFDNVRIPRDQMLARFAQVARDGTYTKPPHAKLSCKPLSFETRISLLTPFDLRRGYDIHSCADDWQHLVEPCEGVHHCYALPPHSTAGKAIDQMREEHE